MDAFMELVTGPWVWRFVDVCTLVAVGLVGLQFKRHRIYIGRLCDDAHRAAITPELVKVWKIQIKKYDPDDVLYEAYRKNLIRVGEWSGD